jgi:hypothetical protein
VLLPSDGNPKRVETIALLARRQVVAQEMEIIDLVEFIVVILKIPLLFDHQQLPEYLRS